MNGWGWGVVRQLASFRVVEIRRGIMDEEKRIYLKWGIHLTQAEGRTPLYTVGCPARSPPYIGSACVKWIPRYLNRDLCGYDPSWLAGDLGFAGNYEGR